MKILLTCGGTGGHIIPAIAIADMLSANLPDCEILFVGGESGMERALVTSAGYSIQTLDIRGLSRKNPFSLIASAFKTARAIKAAGTLIDQFSPDIVIGTGGYACYPSLSAAIARGIPSAVHESNAVPGVAVRMLAPRLSRVWLGLEAACAYLPKRTQCLTVGNPLPRGFCIAQEGKREAREKKIILSFGGSLGAPVLNAAVLDLMERTRSIPNVYHVHATGKREWARFSEEMEKRGLLGNPRLEILPFISDMPKRMLEADVVICRAGAMTLGEVAMAGRAAVIVPSPNVTGDHQLKNAMALAQKGAAILVEEKRIGEDFIPSVVSLLENDARRRTLEQSVKAFAHPNANKEIYCDILSMVGQK